jgi:hypothetical protein
VTERLCDKLDDYLGGWLANSVRAEFEAHLARCSACRDEVERQRRLDGLLDRAGDSLESVPPGLVGRIERRITAAQWRSRAVKAVAGLAAAAVVVLSVLLWPERPVTGPSVSIVEKTTRPDATVPDEPAVGPIDRRAASRQLAMLVVSHCGSSCPAGPRWARVPEIAPPRRHVTRAFTATVLGEHEAEAIRAGEERESPKVARGTSATDASFVRTHRTLGTRQAARVAYY